MMPFKDISSFKWHNAEGSVLLIREPVTRNGPFLLDNIFIRAKRHLPEAFDSKEPQGNGGLEEIRVPIPQRQ